MASKLNDYVTNRLQIYSLLQRIHKSNQLISLSFESLPHYCITALLDLHPDAKVLVFDEANPEISETLLNTKNTAEFSLKLEQLPVSFKSRTISMREVNGINRLYTHYPTEIYYPQNRHYFRFQTKLIHGIDTSISISSTHRLECELINISVQGVCLSFPIIQAPLILKKQIIDDIYIQLPFEDGFSLSAKVKNSRITNKNSNILMGLQFHHPKPDIEKIIQQFIFRTENQQPLTHI